MKIIMDFRKYDGVVGGVEQGAIQIAKSMSGDGNECVLVCKKSRESDVRDIFGERDGLKIVLVDVATHAICDENRALDAGFFQDLAVEEGADLIHYFYNWSFPKNKKVPTVLTVHDVIPFTFQEAMADEIHKNIYKPGITEACELNDIIATVSEYSRQDIAEKTGAPLDKIHVVYNGLRDPEELDPTLKAELVDKFGIADGCVLNVGGIHERKNIVRLVEAFAALVKDKGYKGNLLITGSASGAPYQEKMRKLCDAAIADTGMTDRVIFTGFISEVELDILLEIADMMIYPSLYEGFGIPILESMQAGTPVITSNVTAMPEVAGDAGLLVDPCSVPAMTAAMSSILEDESLRNDLITKGKERAKGFSWAKNGKEYVELYKKVLSR